MRLLARAFVRVALAILAVCGFWIPVASASITGCTLSTTGITFTPYDEGTKPTVNTTGTVTASCSGSGSGASTTISLALSTGGSGSCTTRKLANGANTLPYNVYTDNTYSTVWCGATTLSFALNLPNTSSHTFTLYGQIPSGQNVPALTYTDSLTATLSWPNANSTTTPVPISDTVLTTCTVSASNLAFPNYIGASTTASSTVTVNCGSGASYTVALSGGSNLSGSVRQMAGPTGNYIPYDLFSNSGYSASWGDGTSLGAVVSGSGTGSNQALTVYGRTRSGPIPQAGSYSDTVTVTVTY